MAMRLFVADAADSGRPRRGAELQSFEVRVAAAARRALVAAAASLH
jgi:hypothetical protein